MLEEREDLPRAQVDREHCHRQLRLEAAAHQLRLVGGLAQVRGRHPRGRLPHRAVIGPAGVRLALDEGAGAERFVGVDGDDAGAAREIGQFPGFAGVEVDRPQRGDGRIARAAGEVEVRGPGADDDGFRGTRHERLFREGREIDHADAPAGCEDRHLLSVGREGVVVEIKAV